MVRIASLKETVDASYDLGACGGPCTKVSRYISDIYGLKLVVVTDRDSLNAVDLLFHERLGCTGSDLLPARTPEVQSTHESSSSAEGDNHNSRLASLIQAVCQSQNL